MIEAKYNPELDGKVKATIEFARNDERAFGAIFNNALIGISGRSSRISGTFETSNPTHVRRMHGIGAENVHFDHDSLVAVGCIRE